MKKIILILAIAFVSCKKEKDVIPGKTGNVSFYNGNVREILSVTINDTLIGKTSIKPIGFVADCSTEWAVRYTGNVGNYNYEAKDNSGVLINSGSFAITDNGCTTIEINR